MSKDNDITPITVDIKRHNHISKIWLVPLIALAIAAWMMIDAYANRGSEITITFANAEGLEIGKTRVKTLNVDVGYVTKVELHKDGVIAHVKLEQQASHLLTEDSQFWVVKPRIGNNGVSGLSTLLSGAFIEFVPGKGELSTNEFVGLEQEPITAFGVPGIRLNLVSDKGDSLSIGEPVLYRGFEVGKIESSTFDIEKREVRYQIFVKSPYSELLTSNTYFWNSSGVDFKASTEGIKVNVGSFESIISGGVTFDVPTDLPLGEVIDSNKNHILYPDKDSVYERRQYKAKELMVLFEDSVRGLSVGAPVEYRGIRVGTVAKIDSTLTMNLAVNNEQRIPVMIKLEPARLGFLDEQASIEKVEKFFSTCIKQGLRAKLKSGSLITGSLFVDLDYYDVLPDSNLNAMYQGIPIMPSSAGSLAQIEEKVFAILDKFSALPIDVTVENINTMLATTNHTVTELNEAIVDVKALIGNQETQNIPHSINDTLNQLSKTLEGFNQQAPVYGDIEQSLNDLQQLMRDAKPLVKSLSNKPNSLIFDGQTPQDPEPKGMSK